MIKQLVKNTPLVRSVARKIMRMTAPHRQGKFVSQSYWENRYKERGNSGSGSYNRLAQFKADVINEFILENNVMSVIEFGSGDGAQLRLARYPRYTGVDVSSTALELTRSEFSNDGSKKFIHLDDLSGNDRAELSLSLDVVYHLVEDMIYKSYMQQLFDAASRYVIVYSSNAETRSDSVHVKHRRFTKWVEQNRPDFKLTRSLKNPYPLDVRDLDNTSFADFFFFERVS